MDYGLWIVDFGLIDPFSLLSNVSFYGLWTMNYGFWAMDAFSLLSAVSPGHSHGFREALGGPSDWWLFGVSGHAPEQLD